MRGAVGVALAAGLTGEHGPTLQATVLVVVVLTVIIFGGTTARMLEIMGIRTGVVEEIDSDDEFDIETATNGTYYKSNAVGYVPQRKGRGAQFDKNGLQMNGGNGSAHSSYSSGTPSVSPPNRPTSRNNSTVGQRGETHSRHNNLYWPAVRRPAMKRTSTPIVISHQQPELVHQNENHLRLTELGQQDHLMLPRVMHQRVIPI